jgi:Ca-activated chloride channel family protein
MSLMSTKRKLLIPALLFACAVAAATQDAPDPQKDDSQVPTFKVAVKLVNVYCTVTEANGSPVTDLKKEDFSLSEDGVPQNISVFEQESERPISIVLALDVSGSVRKDLKSELDSAHKFISSILRPQDALSLYQFSETVTEIVPFTSRMSRINDGFKEIHLGAGTALYDAVYLGGEALGKREGRKVMVVITDGGDTMSQLKYSEAVRSAQIAEAIVYSIIMVPIEASAGRNTGGEHALIQISKDTGGKYYYADGEVDLDKAFEQISKELRTQYLLGYYSNRRVADSDFRKLNVTVSRKRTPAATDGQADDREALPVRHRAGYYTSKLK